MPNSASLTELRTGAFQSKSGSAQRNSSVQHFGWFSSCRVRVGRTAAQRDVRGAGGFSNRRFERRFCPLLPLLAKVGRSGERNISVPPRQCAECPLPLLKEMGPPATKRNNFAAGGKNAPPRSQIIYKFGQRKSKIAIDIGKDRAILQSNKG